MTEYVRVTPTSEQVTKENLPAAFESLHKLSNPATSKLTNRVNPLVDTSPPTFQFLALSEGADEPVEFYYGVDQQTHLDTLEKQLKTVYPDTFDVERTQLDVTKTLNPPAEFTPEAFRERLEEGKLWYQPDSEELSAATDTDREVTDGGESLFESEPTVDQSPAIDRIETDEGQVELDPPQSIPDEGALTELDRPTATEHGTVLARPPVDELEPVGLQWKGVAERKQDWMTTIKPYANRNLDQNEYDAEQQRLAVLIDHLTELEHPIAFQVVWQRKPDWSDDAELRKEDLMEGRDTFAQRYLGPMFEMEERPDEDREYQVGSAATNRFDRIEAKHPKRTFTVNIRAIALPVEGTTESLDQRLDQLGRALDPLDGPFYGLDSERIRSKGFRTARKRKRAQRLFQRIRDGDIVTGRGRRKPDLVFNADELANVVVVPSSEQLTVEATRGTRAEQQSRNPLPWPNPDLIQQFQDGMAMGYALDENGEPRPDPIRIPPDLLPTHYGRFASTGGGKSKAIINDALSLRETTGGPVVLVDPKGDGMCENYLRCHYERFGGLDDVYHFRVPETIPAFSFFDIRPALEAGRNREDAVQDKVDHFHDILRMIMGREQYGQAFVANEILSYLTKALFDEEYGSDVFGLDDLFAAALRMQREQTIPPVSADNQTIEESLTRHFAKDNHQFQVSMDAVGNRLDKLKEDAHLRRIFSHVPDQNDAGEYVDNRFDFREFLDEDATIIFDLGDLRPEAQRALTLLLLSNLWDAVQVRRRDGQTDYQKLTNLIIEEAAPVASTKLVSEQLLPQGRSFGLSMGLVMQFPEQVRNRNERAYDEVLNNIKTKLIGNISIERDLAESLAHEDLSPTELRNRINTLPSGEWIAQLPSPSFGETGPPPFSLKPLPIAPGHPESDQPLTEPQEDHFESVSRPRMLERTQAQYGLTEPTESTTSPEETGWGSSGAETAGSAADGDSGTDPTQSAFISKSTAEDASTSTTPTETDSDPDTDGSEISPLFGQTAETDEDPAGDQAAQPENGATPVEESSVPVPDDELRQRGLSRDDVRFLDRVLDVMNREDDEYTLLDRMSQLRDEYDDLHIERLTEHDLVEADSAAGRKYYTVLPDGRDLLGRELKAGPGAGDLGEKTPHKVGVRLLELWLHQRDGVVRVEPYYETDDGAVLDVAGFDEDGDLVWAGEAELASNNRHAQVEDYDKLSVVDADAIWAFNNRETALDVLDSLADADRIDERVSGRTARSFTTIRDTVDDFDAAGLTTVRGFKNLDQELNQ